MLYWKTAVSMENSSRSRKQKDRGQLNDTWKTAVNGETGVNGENDNKH